MGLGGVIGSRDGLKIHFQRWSVGSSPTRGTTRRAFQASPSAPRQSQQAKATAGVNPAGLKAAASSYPGVSDAAAASFSTFAGGSTPYTATQGSRRSSSGGRKAVSNT